MRWVGQTVRLSMSSVRSGAASERIGTRAAVEGRHAGRVEGEAQGMIRLLPNEGALTHEGRESSSQCARIEQDPRALPREISG